MANINHTFKFEKEQTLKIARELLYGPDVIEKLSKAKTSIELTKIMNSARKGLI